MGLADTTVEPSGGVVGLMQQNTDEGQCPLDNSSEMLMKTSLVLVLFLTSVEYRYDGCIAPCCVIMLRLGC